MVNTDSIRTKINTKVFVNLGSSATISAYTATSTDKWGDTTSSYGTATSLTIVPWFHIKGREEFFDFGDLETGEVDVAVKYDQSININDKIVYQDKTYYVKQIEHYSLKDAILVKVARLKEVDDT